MKKIKQIIENRIKADPYLEPFKSALYQRIINAAETEKMLTGGKINLCDYSSGHEYFGLHFREDQWFFREWAPNAVQIYFLGTMTDWKELPSFALKPLGKDGIWEICFPGHMIKHQDLYRLSIHWPGGKGDRIPAYARRVVQDPDTLIFNAQVWNPPQPYVWEINDPIPKPEYPLVYEAHVGMAQDAEKVGTYNEFKENILPRIIDSGYNTIQLMAVQHHPYYGSFGYHVSSFFAASSRFGTPDELKSLIDTAHKSNIRVIMDLVHSHCVSNQVEGLSLFDGTLNQYFHDGPRGFHEAWDSRCFDYGKYQVIHFLLSNCRYWLDEFHVDGFRFDGITSMLYLHHGLGKAFISYNDYFDQSVDDDALVYLTLANKLIHTLRSDAVTIAEDVSGMPGLALPVSEGGTGFDFRFAMGVPDFWIKLIKEYKDEQWHMGTLWHELTNRRKDEKTISYAESHDQALVGDQTIIFRLMNREMYEHMHIHDQNLVIDRGMALHKMIRLITLTTAGAGYLNFMGNEFGHPEWIDFPRQGNNWTYKYAKRQWNLVDNPELKYKFLAEFDKDMINLANRFEILKGFEPELLYIHEDDKIIAYSRGKLVYIFNFHPVKSFTDYKFDVLQGTYKMIFNTDRLEYGGHGRLKENQSHTISLYLPSRCAIVLHRI
ncbi:1,4-alpha-glucan-branching enzyme [Desulfonema limicola]|uniref:1,4-alpha-glucan branching enzyme n=1 Tax=Desulfonema limicola TaxID=45656 RepID=A0A975B642_9BACT|nr:alpha amylase C-terminal domain-containing protein [Desulfonema limicola]QTA79525.1 1,4-alpha-glucan-branching enzyme [Desulfonema limicola]